MYICLQVEFIPKIPNTADKSNSCSICSNLSIHSIVLLLATHSPILQLYKKKNCDLYHQERFSNMNENLSSNTIKVVDYISVITHQPIMLMKHQHLHGLFLVLYIEDNVPIT